MHFINAITLQLTLSLILGIVVGFYGALSPQGALWGLLVLLPLLYVAYAKQSHTCFPYFEVGGLLATVLIGIFSVGLGRATALACHYTHHTPTAKQLWHLKIDAVLQPTAYAQRYVAKVKAVDKHKRIGKILLTLQADVVNTRLAVDDEIAVLAAAVEIAPPLNPHQFNYRAYTSKQGISHQIRSEFGAVQHLAAATPTLKGLAAQLRQYLIAHLQREAFGQEELGVMQALLLGQRDAISERTYTAYADAGAIHILAVSGLHVGILLLLLQLVLSPLARLPHGKTLQWVLLVGLLWAYAFVAGLSPSVVRAVTMFSFVAYALYLNRPTHTFNVVVLSLFFMLLVNPLFLFQLGFQMSYAAVFAIVCIYPKLQHLWRPRAFVLRKAWQLLAVSLAAQLGVLPLSLFYFHQFPALFFVANLVVVPFLGIVLGVGLVVVVLSSVKGLPLLLTVLYNALLEAMNAVVGWVARQEEFIVRDIPFDEVQLVLGYGIVLALGVLLYSPRGKNALLLLLGLLAFQVWTVGQQWTLRYKERFMLMHSWQNTVLVHQTGARLLLYAQDTTKLHALAQRFSVAEGAALVSWQGVKNGYRIGSKLLYVMDSLGHYPPTAAPDFLLLTQSPKMNLERLLDSLPPQMVLADGSNYRSYVARWRKTCAAQGVPFYYTAEKGAFYFELEE